MRILKGKNDFRILPLFFTPFDVAFFTCETLDRLVVRQTLDRLASLQLFSWHHSHITCQGGEDGFGTLFIAAELKLPFLTSLINI